MNYPSFFDEEPQITIEDTELYKLIAKGTKNSIREAWRLVANLHDDDIKRRSTVDRGTYLHQIVNLAPEVTIVTYDACFSSAIIKDFCYFDPFHARNYF